MTTKTFNRLIIYVSFIKINNKVSRTRIPAKRNTRKKKYLKNMIYHDTNHLASNHPTDQNIINRKKIRRKKWILQRFNTARRQYQRHSANNAHTQIHTVSLTKLYIYVKVNNKERKKWHNWRCCSFCSEYSIVLKSWCCYPKAIAVVRHEWQQMIIIKILKMFLKENEHQVVLFRFKR